MAQAFGQFVVVNCEIKRTTLNAKAISRGTPSVMFLPDAAPMAPANLSKFGGISFAAKGEGATYQFMVFATHLGRMPVQRPFTAGPEWKRVSFSFADLGVDGTDLMGFFVGAGPAVGPFRLQIDDVRLEPK